MLESLSAMDEIVSYKLYVFRILKLAAYALYRRAAVVRAADSAVFDENVARRPAVGYPKLDSVSEPHPVVGISVLYAAAYNIDCDVVEYAISDASGNSVPSESGYGNIAHRAVAQIVHSASVC